jgi:hypothetical protein
MDYATKSGYFAGTWKLLRRRFADWANEGHSLIAQGINLAQKRNHDHG